MMKAHETNSDFTPPQRRFLRIMLSVGLLALIGLVMGVWWLNSPIDLPALIAWSPPSIPLPPDRQSAPTPSPTYRPSATPDDSSPWFGHVTSGIGELPGATSTPSVRYIYLAPVSFFPPAYGPVLTPVSEPPPVPPAPDWPPGRTELTGSKLGVHVTFNNDPYIMEFVRRVRPRVMKAVGDLGWLSDVKQVSPNTVTIGRLMPQNEDWVMNIDPTVAAEQYIDEQLGTYLLNPGVDFWEGWNEFEPVDLTRMDWYAKFEARRVCYLQEKGLRGAVGGFSTGVPEYEEMKVFAYALEAAHRCGGIFTLHEYSSPFLSCGTVTGRENIIPGAPHLDGPLFGALALRYRFWYEGILKPMGIGDVPLVISELGVAAGPPNGACGDPGGNGAPGWTGYQDWWVKNGFGSNGEEAYVNILAWYDQEMRKDSYVIGATIFNAGGQDAANTWHSFDLHNVFVPLAKYAVQQEP